MALYHFHVDQVKRSAGHTAIAAAAYRSGTKLHCDYYGENHDYTKKSGVVFSEIILPEYAPPEYADREVLWNAVEKVEKHPQAQLAYSFDIALQNELSMEENIALAREFIQSNFIAKGMLTDWAVHLPDKEENGIQNPHFHVIAPIRPILENGEWGDKQHREYLLDEEGNPILDKDGKQKYNAVQNTDWGRPETLEMWRENWANMVNARFEEKGLDCRVDHRSYEDQALDLIPQVHEGSAVRKMEKKGIKTEKGELNRWIKRTNQLIMKVARTLKSLTQWYSEIKSELQKLKEPELMDLVNDYFDERNRVADTYGRGKQKAKIGNMKSRMEVFNYLNSEKIFNLEQLGTAIVKKNTEAEKVKRKKDKAKAFVSDLTDKITAVQDYQKLKPICDKYNSIHFKSSKEKYKLEHEKELKQFFKARRIISPFLSSDMEQIVQTWSAGLESGKKKYAEIEQEYRPLKQDADMLGKIRKAVNFALEQGSGGSTENKMEKRISELNNSSGIGEYVQKAKEYNQSKEHPEKDRSKKQDMER